MKTYFSLDEPIVAAKLLNEINRMVNLTNHLNQRVMVIEIKETTVSDNVLLPLLEYKGASE